MWRCHLDACPAMLLVVAKVVWIAAVCHIGALSDAGVRILPLRGVIVAGDVESPPWSPPGFMAELGRSLADYKLFRL
jgi:hypothetical protein